MPENTFPVFSEVSASPFRHAPVPVPPERVVPVVALCRHTAHVVLINFDTQPRPRQQRMAEGGYRMGGLATTFVKFSEIEKVFENIVHPTPDVKKQVILFDGAED